MASSKKVAFIGLGVMGFPMARHLSVAGHDVVVYNRTASRSEAWVKENGGRSARTPAQAVEGVDLAFLCVGNDDDVRSVVLGEEGVLNAIASNAAIVDHTTASATLAVELNQLCGQRDIGFIDAPISGGQAGAENGSLTVMCGGEEKWFEFAQPVIASYSQACNLIGPSGSGQLTKMVNQLCIAGVVQGLAEGINFAQHAGLDGERVLDVISKGAAQSWQMENRGSTMLKGEFEFGFATDWMRKDLGLCFEEAKKNGALLPMAMLVDQFYAHVQQRGGGRWDTSSLIHLLQKI